MKIKATIKDLKDASVVIPPSSLLNFFFALHKRQMDPGEY